MSTTTATETFIPLTRAAFARAVVIAKKLPSKTRCIYAANGRLVVTDFNITAVIPDPATANVYARVNLTASDIKGTSPTVLVPATTCDEADIPTTAISDETLTATLPVPAVTALRAVEPFASTNAIRSSLHGVYIEFLPGSIRLTACNGHVLSERTATAAHDLSAGSSAIIPLAAVNILLRTTHKKPLPVSLTAHIKASTIIALTFNVGDTPIHTLTVQYPYPNATALNLHHDQPGMCVINRLAFLRAVELVQPHLTRNGKQSFVRLVLGQSSEIQIYGMSELPELASARYILDRQLPRTIGLDRDYLLTVLRTTTADEVEMRYNGPLDQVTFHEPSAVSVIMPIRI